MVVSDIRLKMFVEGSRYAIQGPAMIVIRPRLQRHNMQEKRKMVQDYKAREKPV